jgi:hypothetical protein
MQRNVPSNWFQGDGFRGMGKDDPLKKFILDLTVPLGEANGWESDKALHVDRRPTASQALFLLGRLVSDLQRLTNSS